MRLGQFLVMGRGEAASGGADRSSNRANAFEAVVGAVLLDRGFRFAQAFVLRWMKPEIVRILAADTPKDPKSLLQEILQSRGRSAPVYRLTGTSGPPEDRSFSVCVEVEGAVLGKGAGPRKIEAEREAARRAMKHLLAESIPQPGE
jgi:ribonuclease-3